jgi:hypothetical protein
MPTLVVRHLLLNTLNRILYWARSKLNLDMKPVAWHVLVALIEKIVVEKRASGGNPKITRTCLNTLRI